MSKTIADHLAQTLAAAGVSHIWGVSGDSLNGLTDSLQRIDSINWMHTRHEEVAAFAAGAQAASSGKLAVCAGSCGPGNLHLINGLYDCHRNRVPVLAIAAHIPSSEIGLDYFQETHPQELFKECSHFVELVSNPEQFPRVLERAMRAAISQKGVAVIVLPGDVALSESPDVPAKWVEATPPTVVPADTDLQSMADMLNDSKAVTLLCGAGCAGAHEQILALADTLGAPIVHALRGKQHVEYDNPFDVGMTGLIGFSSGYHAMLSCDTLVILGSSFPYRNFYPEKANIIQIDLDPTQLGRRTPVALGLSAACEKPSTLSNQNSSRTPTAVSSTKPSNTTPRPVKILTNWLRRPPTARRFTRNTSRGWSMNRRTPTQSLPSMSARQPCGPRATCT